MICPLATATLVVFDRSGDRDCVAHRVNQLQAKVDHFLF